MGDLSEHFNSSEFADHSTKHFLQPPAELLRLLEAIRRVNGRPLIIVSGHRCCAHNAAVGGASQSRHIHGDAADIPSGRCSLPFARVNGAKGIGISPDGWVVHVDVRPGPVVEWSYGTASEAEGEVPTMC